MYISGSFLTLMYSAIIPCLCDSMSMVLHPVLKPWKLGQYLKPWKLGQYLKPSIKVFI